MPRRLDPNRCLKPPVSVKSLIGPDPRILADDIWAKLVWAGLNLEESDLPLTGSQHHFYPVTLVRAITISWLFAGLRWMRPCGCESDRFGGRTMRIRPA